MTYLSQLTIVLSLPDPNLRPKLLTVMCMQSSEVMKSQVLFNLLTAVIMVCVLCHIFTQHESTNIMCQQRLWSYDLTALYKSVYYYYYYWNTMTASFAHDSVFQSWLFTIYCRTYVRQFICRPFATLHDPYTAKREIATIMNDTWMASFRPCGLQACDYQLTTADFFTFWWSNPNIAIVLGYKLSTKSIFFTKCVTSI